MTCQHYIQSFQSTRNQEVRHFWNTRFGSYGDKDVGYLLPGEAHPLEALLAVVGTVRADELEEVVSFQVAGLLSVKLGWTPKDRRMTRKRES